MHLKRLELSGFKSFAKPAKLEFPAPISGIVGPNGSGKSNVVEAMRWVLGEQSMKSLRGKRGEDLIFNGSQTAPRLGKASVSLIFDNRNKNLPIDFDEVKITRKVFRDGVNEYFINNSQVRLKDIVGLLSKIGLGTSNHHIISQGEADRILNASLKERRQMIEDALGLKIYQLRKLESERKLSKTEENIYQIEALRKEIQPHLRFLKKQVDKVQEAISLKDELKKLYHWYFAEEGVQIESEEKRILKEKKEPEDELKKIEKDFSSNHPVGTKSAAPEDQRTEKIKKEKNILKEDLSKLEAEVNGLRIKRNSLERELGRFEGMIEMEENRMKSNDEELVSASQIYKFTNRIGNYIDEGLGANGIEETKKALNGVKETIKEFLSSFDSEGSISSLDLDNLKKKKQDTLSLLDEAREREKKMLGQCSLLESGIAKKEEELRVLERKKYEAGARMRELRGILSNLDVREKSLIARKEEFEQDKREAVALVGGNIISGNLVLGNSEASTSNKEEREKTRRQIERFKIRLEDSDAIGEDVLREYEDAKNRNEFFEKELGDLRKASESLAGILKELEEKIDSDFKSGIEKINKEFQIFFTSMFGGGRAELKVTVSKTKKNHKEDNPELEVSEDEEMNQDEGVDVSIILPQKRI
ncbi:MAG TPA: hypothetical protein ENH22_00300, partial [Candidatus Campbellbacteria bacterium]|nr:hypothetical protein [Candidatus Campbellbacteria bacterium]